MQWYWEKRANDEYTPPQISTFLEGWDETKAKADVKSPLDPTKEVFVRELVQNFVDAARDKGAQSSQLKPKLSFRFLEYSGAEAQQIATKLNLDSISTHHATINKPEEMRLPESHVVEGKFDYLRLLVVAESGTSGMYGHWDRSSSTVDSNNREIQQKMRDALLATVRGSAGRGLGSFGEGKKAVIGISKCRTLFAYTCFDRNTSENGASRRFMGGLYWQTHDVGTDRYSGFGMIGGNPSPDEKRPRPYEDTVADSKVQDLNLPGFEIRNPNDPDTFGTTLLFIEPNIEPDEVLLSLHRNWWPLLQDGSVDFEVIDSDGTNCQLETPSYLQPFLLAYQASETVKVKNWESADATTALNIEKISSLKNPNLNIGDLKLAIDLRPNIGWSQAEPESNWSIVALIRDGMLIAYQNFPLAKKTPAPFVRGVFVVDSSVNPEAELLLRRTEPPLHNKWRSIGPEIDPRAREIAGEVYGQIKTRVEDFRQEHIAASASREFELELFKTNLAIPGGRRKVNPVPPNPKNGTIWSMLSSSAQVFDNGDGRRYAEASRSIQLAKKSADPHKVRVEIGWQVLEDGKWKDAYHFLLTGPIEAPTGFTRVEGTFNEFVGNVVEKPRVFKWKSAPYRDLWTLRPYMKVVSLVEIVDKEDSE